MKNEIVSLKPGWADVLTLIFVVLKLTGNIAWSWWWVFSPLLISIPVILVFVIIAIIANQ